MNPLFGVSRVIQAAYPGLKHGLFPKMNQPSFKRAGAAAASVLFVIVVWVIRQYFASYFPMLLTGISLLLFLIPGIALSLWVFPELGVFERIGAAFTFSMGLMVIPSLIVMTTHKSIAWLFWIFVVMAVFSILAILLRLIFQSKQPARAERLHPLYILIFAGFAVALCVISLQMPLIGDDWQGMPFLQDFLVSDHVNLIEPFHGTNYPPTARSEFGVWAADFALIIKLSGLDPITHYRFLRPFMLFIALSAFYMLSRKLFQSPNKAAFISILWMFIVLLTISWGDVGYDLLARINQDKYALRYILLPVALSSFIGYFKTRRTRDLVFFAFAGWAAGGTHPMGPVLIGLPCLGFGLIHLAFERSFFAFRRLATAAFCLTFGLILPFIQLISAGEDWLAFELQDTVDPNLLTRLSMATRTEHLWLLPNGNYALHPAVVLSPLILISLLGIPYLIVLLRKSIPARLLLGTLIVVPAVLYFPLTARIIGRFVTPWLLYRLAWSIPLVSLLIIGWCFFDGGFWALQRFFNENLSTRKITLFSLSVLALLALIFSSSIRINLAYLDDVRTDPDKAQCQDVAPLLTELAQNLHQNSVVLANHDLNFCIPAFSPYAKVIEYRWTTTISRFPLEHRDEAIQRLKDVSYYSSTRFFDQELSDILGRYNVRYILIQRENPLAIQFKHLPEKFVSAYLDDHYILFRVVDGSSDLPMIRANTFLAQEDWPNAEEHYSKLLAFETNTNALAHLGLSEAYLSQGQVEKSIDELSLALVAAPDDELIWGILADTQVAAGQYREATVSYQKAMQLNPSNAKFLEKLGTAYLLAGQTQEADKAFIRAIDLQAPVGSARWHRLLGDRYASVRWNTKAINAYQKSLSVLPNVVSVEIKIGDVYLRKGDLDLARSTYLKAKQLDRFSPEAISRLGILAEKSGDLTEATKNYRMAVRLKPVSLTDYVLLTSAIRKDQGVDEAIAAIKNSPGYSLSLPGPLCVTGILYESQGFDDQAAAEYEEAIERFPVDSANERVALSMLLLKKEKTDEASQNLKEAMTLEPTIAYSGYIASGKIKTKQGKSADASGSFYKAILTEPLDVEAYVLLAKQFEFQANTGAALEIYQRAFAIQPNAFEGLLAYGKFFYSNGNLDQAVRIFQQLVETYPEYITGYIELARAFQKQGQLSQAMQIYEQANQVNADSPPVLPLIIQGFRLFSDTDLATAQYELAIQSAPNTLSALQTFGYFLLAQNQLADAEKTFREAIEMNPSDGKSRVGLASALLVSGYFEEGLQQLKKATEIGDWKGNAFIAVGNEYNRRGNFSEAVEAYKNAILYEPALVDGYLQLGKLYETLGDWNSAQEQYQKAIRLSPSSGAAYTAAGKVLVQQGELDLAVEKLQTSIDVDPYYTEAYSVLGQVQTARGKIQEVERLYDQATKRLPGSAAVWMALANFRGSQGNMRGALDAVQEAVNVEPGNAGAWLELGSFYKTQGNFQEAEKSILTAIQHSPGDIGGYLALGDLYELQGKIDNAEEIYKTGIKIDQSQAKSYISLGNLHFAKGQIQEALMDFKQATEREPGKIDGYIRIGAVFEAQGDFPQAIRQYEKAASLPNSSADAYLAMGGLYRKKGQWDDALNSFRHATEVEPYRVSTWITLGDFYAFRGNFPEAESAYSKAVEVNVGDADGWIRLGSLYQGLNQTEKAFNALRSAIKIEPGSGSSNLALGKFYQDQGEWDLAKQSYQKAIELAATPDGYLALGELLELQGNDTGAFELYRKAVARFPMAAEVYLAFGKLEENRGNDHEAEYYFKQSIQSAPALPDGYIQMGIYYMARSEWEKALEELEQSVQVAPGSAEAHIALGKLYLRFQEKTSARDQFERALSLDLTIPDSFIYLANLDFSIGDQDSAIQHLQHAVVSSPTDLAVYTALGQTNWWMGDSESALSAYSQGIQKSNSIPDAYIARASSYIIQGKWQQARTDLEAAWNLNPKSQEIGIYFANFLANRGEITQAEQVLNQLTEFKNATSSVYISLGNLYQIRADWAASRAAYEKAVTLGGDLTDAYAGLARVAELEGKTDEALQHNLAAVKYSPQNPQAWMNLGDAYQSQLKWSDAKHAYENALQADPLNLDVYIRLDQLSWAMDGTGIDLSHLYDLANTIPSVEVNNTIAYLLQKRGEVSNSLPWVEESTQLDPYDASSWLALGDTYRALKHWKNALNAYRQAQLLVPSSASATTAIGMMQEQMDQPEEALASYQKAADADPLAWQSHFSIVTLLSELHRSTEAVTLSQKWLAAAPGSEQGYIILEAAYIDHGQDEQALQTIQAGIELMPGSSPLLTAEGNWYRDRFIEAGNTLYSSEAAFYWAENLLISSQKQIDLLYSSEGWRLSAGRREKIHDVLDTYNESLSDYQSAQHDFASLLPQAYAADTAYQAAIHFLPTNDLALIGLGQIQDALGDPEKALDYYQEAVSANPLSNMARVFLGNAYLKVGKPLDAIPQYQQIILRDSGMTAAQLGLVKAYQSLKELDPYQAAVVIEQSQFAWEGLMDHKRMSIRD